MTFDKQSKLAHSASATICSTISDHGCCSRSVRAMIHNRLDYCNSLLAGLPTSQMSRLQSVLRAAARLVLGLPVSAAMHDTLHWLSFPQRVTFKLCLLTYKCLHGLAPDYLSRFCALLTSVTPFLAVLCYVQLTQTNCWYHGPVRPALDCVPSVLLVRLPGMTCRLICATWTYL